MICKIVIFFNIFVSFVIQLNKRLDTRERMVDSCCEHVVYRFIIVPFLV